MKGLYLGCSSKHLSESKSEFKELHTTEVFPEWLPINGEIISLNQKISDLTKVDDESRSYICVSGWFLYKDKLNDLEQLFSDLDKKGKSALKNITGGVFIALFVKNGEFFIFNDPMGFSNHYYLVNENGIQLAPSIAVIERENENLEKVPSLVEFLNKRGHLFGDKTSYKNVFRLDAGCILCSDGKIEPYIELLTSKKINAEDVYKRVAQVINCFPEDKRHIPLSGGLDSRLMVACAKFTFGYCYGPENSADRPIARNFSDDFEQFEEYEFDKPDKKGNEALIYNEITETPSQFLSADFLASYRYVSQFRPEANVVFDGYLGDTLQRGVWLYLGGIKGELYRFFPILYTLRPVTARYILSRRYGNLSPEVFELFYSDFQERTQNLDLDDYAKVTYYDFIWGRGARFVNNGALLMNGQFAHVVPVFSDPIIFSSLIKENFKQTIRFKMVDRIWKNIEQKYKSVKFENGYKVSTPNFLKPKLALMWRLLINYVPGFQNYGTKKRKPS